MVEFPAPNGFNNLTFDTPDGTLYVSRQPNGTIERDLFVPIITDCAPENMLIMWDRPKGIRGPYVIMLCECGAISNSRVKPLEDGSHFRECLGPAGTTLEAASHWIEQRRPGAHRGARVVRGAWYDSNKAIDHMMTQQERLVIVTGGGYV